MGPPKTKGSRTCPIRNHRHSVSALRDTFSVEALVTSFPACGPPKMAFSCLVDFDALHDMPLGQQLLAIRLASPGNRGAPTACEPPYRAAHYDLGHGSSTPRAQRGYQGLLAAGWSQT